MRCTGDDHVLLQAVLILEKYPWLLLSFDRIKNNVLMLVLALSNQELRA